MITGLKILFLSPHPDDIEFGCGGTIKKLSKTNDIYCAIFSNCEESLPKEYDKNDIIKECKESLEILNVKINNIFFYDFKVRNFNFYRQEILDELIKLKKNIKPDIIFTPSLKDIHQDHYIISSESIRAFKDTSSIICYELVWNNQKSNNNTFFELSENDLTCKIKAISKYKSQKNRIYSNEDFIRSLAVVRGIQNYTGLSEAFEVIKFKFD